MTESLETIGGLSSARDAAMKMRDKNISSLLVVEGNSNNPIGIVTERDLVTRVCVHSAPSKNTIVEQIMSSPLVTIDATSSVETSADIMSQNQVRHLLVVEDEDIAKPLGIITPGDFARYLGNKLHKDHPNAKILKSFDESNQ